MLQCVAEELVRRGQSQCRERAFPLISILSFEISGQPHHHLPLISYLKFVGFVYISFHILLFVKRKDRSIASRTRGRGLIFQFLSFLRFTHLSLQVSKGSRTCLIPSLMCSRLYFSSLFLECWFLNSETRSIVLCGILFIMLCHEQMLLFAMIRQERCKLADFPGLLFRFQLFSVFVFYRRHSSCASGIMVLFGVS